MGFVVLEIARTATAPENARVIVYSMNKSSSYSLPPTCYQNNRGFVSKISCCVADT